MSPAEGQIDMVSPMCLLAQNSVRVTVTMQGQTRALQTLSVSPAALGSKSCLLLVDLADDDGPFAAEAVAADHARASINVLSTTVRPPVSVGGTPAAALFIELVPQFSGIPQINFLMPQSALSPSSVSVIVTTGAHAGTSVKLTVQ